jgi:hypothetical protein
VSFAHGLSFAQKRLLFMAGHGGCYVHRGEVRSARALADRGLGTLEDNGDLARFGTTASDRRAARWYFTPNEAAFRLRARIRMASRP